MYSFRRKFNDIVVSHLETEGQLAFVKGLGWGTLL